MYSLYQSEIVKASQNTKLHHHSEMHRMSSKGEALCTDYFYTPEKKSRCLVHLEVVNLRLLGLGYCIRFIWVR